MKSILLFFSVARIFAIGALLALGARAHAQTDPLPSWNDGPAKQAIVEFVQATTTQGSPKFVPPAERIATFDQDGTLWVEHPMYTQVMYCLERVPAVVKAKPELQERRAVQDGAVRQPRGDGEALDEGPREDPRRHPHRHVGGRVQRRSEEVARRRPRIRAGSGPTPSSPTCRCRRC